ncbi:Wadjet anti-phage system protein JetD domain-containing protein [Duganella sp. CF517]|uniref:Wadjet anti-phage system protein JetD domain-containing protein n=1 Tax=Duganella sp. CF517 TaxID=1881038 RepID=UPI0015A593CD|nr:Wadjet anti-phage system protein JetD domain-containing protein [Duganella sp. CF517]
MLDEATMLRFSTLWTEEQTQHAADDFSALTREERAVCGALRKNTWGQKLRLQPERIGWDVAWPTLKEMVHSSMMAVDRQSVRDPRRAD